jgi:glycosyltransferase involved in cell wall biosynthesis
MGIRLACTTIYDARDPAAYDGRTYHQLQAVRAQVQAMHFIGPLSRLTLSAPWVIAKREYYRRIKKIYLGGGDRLMVKSYGRQIARRLATLDANIVFSPMSPSSQPISYLDCKQPIVIWTDAPFPAFVGFYPELSKEAFSSSMLRDSIENERAALARVSLAIYWTEWAAQSAIRNYRLDPAKVRAIAPGPALDKPISLEDAEHIVRARPKDRCRLLFVGSPWIRKGGDKALEVASMLNAAGLPTELVVVGSQPPADEPLPSFVRVLGFLSRTSKDGVAKLEQLFKTSHFMLLPSQAETFGLVFAEANAFALPSLTTDVGGIPAVVRSGINGATFPLTADAAQYCAYIEDLFAHYERYEQLAFSAFAEFQTRLNNRAAATSVISAMLELV